jgi:hypothetical protein
VRLPTKTTQRPSGGQWLHEISTTVSASFVLRHPTIALFFE